MRATLSIWGLLQANPDLFAGLDVPEGVDKQLVIDNILLDGMDLEVLYADPLFMQRAISVWAAKRLPVWKHLYETTQYEYDPIYNYDRHETAKFKRKYSPATTQTVGSQEYTAGFNSAGNAADTPRGRSSGTSTMSGHDDDESENEIRAYGNIGVTTTQQMIQSEREVAEFNIVDYITRDFRQRFMLLIY